MGAGGGYSSELMARAVAPNGVVFAQNPSDLADRAKTAFAARMATPPMKNVGIVMRSGPSSLLRSQLRSRLR